MANNRIQQRISCITLFVSFIFADVRLPPSILTHPSDVIFRTDETFRLECTAEGVPQVEFKWYHNDDELDAAKSNIKELTDGSIEITGSGSLDEGYYQCIAFNQWGLAMSHVALVRRARLNTEGDTSVKPYTALVGEPVKIICNTGNTFPKPSVKWQIADSQDDDTTENLPLSSRIQIDLDGNLHFMNVIEDDSQNDKIYKCLMHNPYLDIIAGGSYSKLTVTPGSAVKSDPVLTFPKKEETNKIALLGKEITLQCLFSGFPTPEMKWKKKNGNLPHGRYTITNSRTQLTITDVETVDEGEYECTGSNDKDSASHTIMIDVQSTPEFIQEDAIDMKPGNLNKTEGESASFFCKTDAEPYAQIQWFVNGEPINSDNPGPRRTVTNGGTNFTIRDICKACGGDETDLSVIQCNASNVHGYAYSQGYLNVLERTVLTQKPEDVSMIAWEDSVIFMCDAGSDQSTSLTIIWKHNDVQVDTSRPVFELDENNLKVLAMNEEDEERRQNLGGKYTCEASNGYSSDSASAQLILPEAPMPPPIAEAGVSILDYWWVLLIIVIVLLLIILCAVCYICYRRNKGDEYLVDEEDRKNGFDPEKELSDSGFHDFQRSEAPLQASRVSLTSTIKLDTDDEASLLEYGEPDAGKFNEDGSFIGLYHDKSRRYDDSTF